MSFELLTMDARMSSKAYEQANRAAFRICFITFLFLFLRSRVLSPPLCRASDSGWGEIADISWADSLVRLTIANPSWASGGLPTQCMCHHADHAGELRRRSGVIV